MHGLYCNFIHEFVYRRNTNGALQPVMTSPIILSARYPSEMFMVPSSSSVRDGLSVELVRSALVVWVSCWPVAHVPHSTYSHCSFSSQKECFPSANNLQGSWAGFTYICLDFVNILSVLYMRSVRRDNLTHRICPLSNFESVWAYLTKEVLYLFQRLMRTTPASDFGLFKRMNA